MSTAADVENKFVELFSSKPLLVRAPGRINLIGEHTDYNKGFVLPAAIDKEIYFAIAQNNENVNCRIYAQDYNELFEFNLDDLKPTPNHWSNYLTGVVYEILKLNNSVTGFNCVFGGNIPQGAGLSSSAAVECGLAFALNQLYSLNIDKMELAKLCQRAEHNFAGVKCGLLDQFSSLFGKANHVMKFDCKTFEYSYFNLNMQDYSILLFNTNVSHNLAESGHLNERFESCYRGVDVIHKFNKEVFCLRDASIIDLDNAKNDLTSIDFNRCKYIIEETERFTKATQLMLKNELKEFGQLMFETHNGLSKLYEVSCFELDVLVDYARHNSNIIGARMMGGGYGGCTINLVTKNNIEQLKTDFTNHYFEKTDKQLSIYNVNLVDGVNILMS